MKHVFLTLCLAVTHVACAQQKAPDPKPASAEPGPVSGKVIETMNIAGYTYVLVDTGKQKVWVAAMQFEVKKGDTAAIKGGMPMENYHSKTLNRDFDLVYFATDVQVNGKSNQAEAAELPAGHPAIGGAESDLPKGHPPLTSGNTLQKSEPIQKAPGGKTVAEIFAGKANLKGKPVAIRGKVVKYNAGILGKNWLHLQDGTGKPGNDDLVITTGSDVKLGDTVLVNGKVSTARDFGSGYKYDVMVEDAKVTVE